jgi:uncharacterized membrane protein YedE/YeeE
MHPAVNVALIVLLAFCVGFATQRGSICGIRAARQVVETGKISRLVAFVTASLWALVIAVPLCWLTKNPNALSPSFDISLAAMLGGALYGLGTFLNGGCVFGTVARIASGNPSFLAALPGIALGAGVGTAAAVPRLKLIAMESPLQEPGLGGFVILMVAAAFVGLALAGIRRTHRRAGLRIGQILRASRWRPSFAMMVIGILGGLLFAIGAQWSYPALLKELGNLTLGQGATFAPAAIAGPFALFTGAIVSAAINGRFVLHAFSGAQLVRSFTGGAAMGFATILIPGGNDSLLLSALPSLAVHGAVAYLAMLGMQIALCKAAKYWKDHGTSCPRREALLM